MSANTPRTGGQGCRRWSPGIAALAIVVGSVAVAQVVSVPPAHLNHAEGSVAYAPQGDQEWHDVQPRRVLKRGDRLWTDRGSRAEVQAGGHALRMNGETQLILENVSDTATQLSLTQGTVAATVTRVNPGDTFEVGTPNLAFRARQPGDYRIDVDAKKGLTRIVVHSGSGVVYGEKGEALEVRTGQRLTFRQRDLTRMLEPAFAATDDFDRWTGARKRGEPTVSMPAIAAAPEKRIPDTITKGRTIVISGSAESLKQPPQRVQRPQATAAAPVAPAVAQRAALTQAPARAMPSSPPTLKVAAPVLPLAASVQSAALPAAPAPQPPAKPQASAQAQAQAAREQQRAAQQRAEERRRAVARRAEEERRQVAARHEQEHKRQLAARRAEEEKQKKLAQARRAAEEKRLAAARKAAEQQKLAAEAARRQHLARLQEQARREEQSAALRRAEAARRADDDRREELARRAEQARREEDARREEQARRDDAERRQKAMAEQARREQARRDEEVWLRQQQPPQQTYQPARPQPMGVPARRIS